MLDEFAETLSAASAPIEPRANRITIVVWFSDAFFCFQNESIRIFRLLFVSRSCSSSGAGFSTIFIESMESMDGSTVHPKFSLAGTGALFAPQTTRLSALHSCLHKPLPPGPIINAPWHLRV
jgi:hypothetical protein